MESGGEEGRRRDDAPGGNLRRGPVAPKESIRIQAYYRLLPHISALVFSNSVIEHVGPEAKQEEFAREVIRLGKRYWVQTPCAWFPIEAHSGMPFYWFYPEQLRAWLLRRSQRKLPGWWTEYIATTRVLSRRRMAELFPNARIRVEFFFGLPKSYIAFSPQ